MVRYLNNTKECVIYVQILSHRNHPFHLIPGNKYLVYIKISFRRHWYPSDPSIFEK